MPRTIENIIISSSVKSKNEFMYNWNQTQISFHLQSAEKVYIKIYCHEQQRFLGQVLSENTREIYGRSFGKPSRLFS